MLRGVPVLVALAGCGRLGFSTQENDAAIVDDSRGSMEASVVDPDLLLWFPFDGALANQGMTQSGITCATVCPATVPGVRGMAARFDGSTTAVRIEDQPALHLTAGSIALWMRPTAFPPMGYAHSLVGMAYGTSSLNSWEVYFYATASGLLLYTGGDAGAGPTQASILWTRGMNQWFHVAATWDGASLQHMYIDGVEVTSAAQFPLLYDGHDVIIGADETNFGIQNNFIGDLDDVRIYDRELTAAEVGLLATP